jgi:hypothetical protein
VGRTLQVWSSSYSMWRNGTPAGEPLVAAMKLVQAGVPPLAAEQAGVRCTGAPTAHQSLQMLCSWWGMQIGVHRDLPPLHLQQGQEEGGRTVQCSECGFAW